MFKDIQYKTKRLIIRPVTIDDYTAFVRGYSECQPALNRFDEVYDDIDFMTLDWFKKLIARREKEAERDYAYKFDIFRREDGYIVGFCNIFPHYREDFQYGRIGYAIHNTYWGLGYATESVEALVKIGFEELKLHRLEAHVNLDNDASKHVLKNAGFRFEGIREAFICEDGIWTDNEIYFINNKQ